MIAERILPERIPIFAAERKCVNRIRKSEARDKERHCKTDTGKHAAAEEGTPDAFGRNLRNADLIARNEEMKIPRVFR